MAPERTPDGPQPRTPLGRSSGEVLVFTVATAVCLLHSLDDAFLNRQPGVGIGQHVLAAVLSLGIGAGAIYAFPALRPAFRSALALFFGVLATVNGLMHVKHITGQGAAESDVTGVLVMAAGVSLIGLAIAIPWMHRGEGPARRRWARRLVAVPLALLASSTSSCR